MDAVILKEEVKTICKKLESMGENSIFISINLTTDSTVYHGSILGKDFLLKKLYFIEEFCKYCKDGSSVGEVTIRTNPGVPDSTDLFHDSKHLQTSGVPDSTDLFHASKHLQTSGNEIQNLQEATNSKETKKDTGEKGIKILDKNRCVSDTCQSLIGDENDIGNVGDDSTVDQFMSDGNDMCDDEYQDENNDCESQNYKNGVGSNDNSGDGSNDNSGDNIELNNSSEDFGTQRQNKNENAQMRYSLRTRKQNVIQIKRKTNKTKKKEPSCKSVKVEEHQDATKRIKLDGDKSSDHLISKSERIFERKRSHRLVDPSSPYYCEICGFTLSQSWYLNHMKQHEKQDKGNWLVTCAVCGEGFLSVMKLKVHLSFKHEMKNLFKCGNCHVRFPSKTSFRHHQPACKDKIYNIESDEDQIKCALCLEDFESENELQKHIDLHKIDPSLTCDFCGKVFDTVFKLRKHKIKHSITGTEYRCTKCPRVFARPTLLKSHLKIYHKEKQHVCKICCGLFPNRELLEEHWKIHNPYDQNTCKKCWKLFSDKETLTEHMKTHEVTLKKLKCHHCDKCGKGFEEKVKLRMHLQSHRDGTPFSCDKCDAKFKRRDTLRKHKKRTHSKDTFMCDMCGNVYNCKETMRHHKVFVHMEKKIYECKYCNRKFRTLSGHHQHILDIHCTQENVHERAHFKVHKCEYCPKMFSIKHLWKDHLNGHTGTCPYICEVCSAKYTNNHDLRCHILTHKTRRFKCNVCDYGFTTHAKYREHLKSKKHKNNIEKAGMVEEHIKASDGSNIITPEIVQIEPKFNTDLKLDTNQSTELVDMQDNVERNEFGETQETEYHIVNNIENQCYAAIGKNKSTELIVESSNDLMDVENSIVLVVTNDTEAADVGDYILQEYDATTSETVRAIISQQFGDIK